MRFSFRQSAAVLACLSLILFCSCEKHHVGELPAEEHHLPGVENQKEKPSEAASPTISPTPAEFFPTSTPR